MRRLQHLERRGAVYYVRLRIPSRLVEHLGSSDFRKSLATKNYAVACRRCMAVIHWFEITIARMERMGAVNREKLEEASASYFAELQAQVDQPRDIPDDYFDQELDFQITETRQELSKLDGVLTSRKFGPAAERSARRMTQAIGTDFDLLDPDAQRAAMEYAVRAERQQMRYLLHGLQTPANRFALDDPAFLHGGPLATATDEIASNTQRPAVLRPDLSLERISTSYNEYLVRTERQGSTRDETARVLRWLQEEIEPATPVSLITHDQMRGFRDCLLILGTGAQGRKLPFRQRLAMPGQDQLKFVTRQRYWRFTTKFFGWLQAEYRIPDPTKDLPFEGGKNELRQSPEPFSTDELQRFLRTPLFSGYKSHHRMLAEGDCLIRNGFWWSAALMMFTGARAGDIAQLLPSDFQFDDPVPHLIIQPGKLPEGVPKRSKFGVRTHKIPLHSKLLDLGIREFVQSRAKRDAGKRLLFEISIGKNRMSDGLTKFWSKHLHEFGLFKPGRATHVHRHTMAARLRAAGVSNEDIGALLGHSDASVTAGYGGGQGLERKLATLEKLDFGFDVVAALGGPYDAKRHRF